MINMWKHYCKVEEDDIEIGEGEECNWCGEEESFGGENKNIDIKKDCKDDNSSS